MDYSFEFEVFQKKFLEAIEELKFRRVLDADNEVKLQQVFAVKQMLEKEMESLTKSLEEAEEKFLANLAVINRDVANNMLQHDEEKTKNRILIEALTNENQMMKQEINKGNLEKLALEKRTKELEGKLTNQESLQKNFLNQASSVKILTEELSEKCLKLTEAQNHLEHHVQEALTVIRNLAKEYQTKKEIMENEKLEKSKLKNELIRLRSEIVANKAKFGNYTIREIEEQQAIIRKSRTDLEYQSSASSAWQAQSEEWKSRFQELTIELNKAHQMLRDEIENETRLRNQMEEWKEKSEIMRHLLEEREQEKEMELCTELRQIETE